jgi:hypothetical protein
MNGVEEYGGRRRVNWETLRARKLPGPVRLAIVVAAATAFSLGIERRQLIGQAGPDSVVVHAALRTSVSSRVSVGSGGFVSRTGTAGAGSRRRSTFFSMREARAPLSCRS